MNPLSIISFTASTFSLTLKLYALFQKTLEFTSSSEKLLLQLEVEHARLVLWGQNSGLAYGELRRELVPFEGLITGLLEKLTGLVEDTRRLREVYGLIEVGGGVKGEGTGAEEGVVEKEKEKRSQSFLRIRDAFRSGLKRRHKPNKPGDTEVDIDLTFDSTTLDADDSNDTTTTTTASPSQSISITSRLRWAITSQSRFESLIKDIRGFTNNLNELLRESQQVHFAQDWNAVQFHVMGGINDTRSLRLMQEVSESGGVCRNLFDMAVRKSIVVAEDGLGDDPREIGGDKMSRGVGVVMLRKEDFEIPGNFTELTRFIALPKRDLRIPGIDSNSGDSRASPSPYLLVEKKRYQPNISTAEKEILRNRLLALIQLLNSTSRDRDNLPLCIGYWSEPENNCWCLVYQVAFKTVVNRPVPVDETETKHPPEVHSLLSLIRNTSFRPPLESRIKLARTLSSVFSRLFGAQWFHKGIRCENILFPSSASPSGSSLGDIDLSTPLITGFEYSRRYTELLSVDYVSMRLEEALYRHPDYQDNTGTIDGHGHNSGDSSSAGGVGGQRHGPGGYRMAYDIYSFGLLLAEIAWWVPLDVIYKEMMKKQNQRVGPSHSSVEVFHAQQAINLKNEVVKRANKELAFRVGTTYRDVVLWCLDKGTSGHVHDRTGTGRDVNEELAVEFYENVVVPMENMDMGRRL